jgi:WD repeat and SOF domain-containing protein 1
MPIHSFDWGADSILCVKFNPAEKNLLASTGTDRSVCLYDVRQAETARKVVMQMKSNAIAWNPREPFNFTVANEDHNLYSFDMRKMDIATCVHKDHVSAVLDVSYSSSGLEFVSGSYDRTVRIFKRNVGRSREVYHGRRMQRVHTVSFTQDTKYVISGSEDTNLRLWKADASQIIRKMDVREKRKMQYNNKLKERYSGVDDVRRILNHRHVPKVIKKIGGIKRIQDDSEKRKEDNRRSHSKPGAVPHKSERKKPVVRILE